LATAYLTASLLVLRPPRANYQQWSLMAALIIAQGVVTLVALFLVRTAPVRYAALAGAVAIALAGALWVLNMLSGPHFEGYALVREVDQIARERRHPLVARPIRRLVQIEHDGEHVRGRVVQHVVLAMNDADRRVEQRRLSADHDVSHAVDEAHESIARHVILVK